MAVIRITKLFLSLPNTFYPTEIVIFFSHLLGIHFRTRRMGPIVEPSWIVIRVQLELLF